MSSFPYFYFTPYQKDINAALQALRQQEFEAGRYGSADSDLLMSSFQFPPDSDSPSPGAQHSSVEEAIKAGGEYGTGSILDIQRVAEEPGFLASFPLPSDWLVRFLGTDKPSRDLVEQVIIQEEYLEDSDEDDVWGELADEMGAGGSCYLIVYEGDEPSEIFFLGYSVD
jgi:hypothetical protein